MKKLMHWIGGEHVPGDSGQWIENRNPATGQIMSLLARGTKNDIHNAVENASAAFPLWAAKTPEARANVLTKIADFVESRELEFAELESSDQGKPVALARRMDIRRVVQNFRFFAGAILHHENESTQTDAQTLNWVLRRPKGVCGLISPWNLPLYLLSWKIAPAIATGNTVVCKPSEFTSMTAGLLAEVMKQAGLPDGVVNMVYGYGHEAGDALVRHPKVPLISFTGGTATGQKIIEASAPHFKKLSLELGGKNPNIIFADADFEKAVATTLRSSFLNQGEICLCGSRIYVEETIFDRFMKSFIPQVEALKVGDPKAPDTFMGPLVSSEHLQKVKSYIQSAKADGAKIWCGGEASPAPSQLLPEFSEGYWLAPTVITGLSESSKCIQEEIFGPVVTVSTFKTVDEAISKANGVKYGLSASVWTQNIDVAMKVSSQLEVGTVWINAWLERDLRVPFGGQKASGLGREGGRHSIEFFTEATNVCVRY